MPNSHKELSRQIMTGMKRSFEKLDNVIAFHNNRTEQGWPSSLMNP